VRILKIDVFGGDPVITDDQLNQYREDGTKLRVIRDEDAINDVRGIVVAWDEHSVLIRKQNRKVLKLSRDYTYQPWELER
jgi:prolyl oligopeptidase PreP (S9A serine peptidase family)